MTTDSKIEWTAHTFNPWWGCVKVHTGCKNCYAETLDKRYGGDHWGPSAPRRMILGEWGKPERWNAEAERAGVMARVFCASMCDLFENYPADRPVLDQQDCSVVNPATREPWTVPTLRARTLAMVKATPWLDWLLLTKRPEKVVSMVPDDWRADWPENVMVGTSPCDQAAADVQIPALLKVPGRRFLSCEPLVGPVDVTRVYAYVEPGYEREVELDALRGRLWSEHGSAPTATGAAIDWVIVGGESGPGARRCDVEWVQSIVRQCHDANVPVFVKQLGSCPMLGDIGDPQGWPTENGPVNWETGAIRLRDRKGGNMTEWAPPLRVREYPPQPARATA